MDNAILVKNENGIRTEIIKAYFDSLPKYTRTDRFSCEKKERGILDYILEVLIKDLDLKNYKYSTRMKTIDFQMKLPNSYLIMNISYSAIDHVIAINAFYPYQYDNKKLLKIAGLITEINSSSELLPLGKVSLIKEVSLINITIKYICKADKSENFDESEFLTYLSSVIVSADRLYKQFEKYLISEIETEDYQ